MHQLLCAQGYKDCHLPVKNFEIRRQLVVVSQMQTLGENCDTSFELDLIYMLLRFKEKKYIKAIACHSNQSAKRTTTLIQRNILEHAQKGD